jgi:hypothetical protein
MPLRPDDESFLAQLKRHKAAGVSPVSLNVSFDLEPPEKAFLMLASFRRWIERHADEYVLGLKWRTSSRPVGTEARGDVRYRRGRAVEAHRGSGNSCDPHPHCCDDRRIHPMQSIGYEIDRHLITIK